MNSKYDNLSQDEILRRWELLGQVFLTAVTEDWEEINVLPEEAVAAVPVIQDLLDVYQIGVNYGVFTAHKEYEEDSVFHGIILELKDSYENDRILTLDRESYRALCLCVGELMQYTKIAKVYTLLSGFNLSGLNKDEL